MGTLFVLVAVVVIGLIVAWNTVPSIREKMRGWSTIFDTVAITALTYFGMFTDGLSEAYKMGYIPKDWYVYVPVVLAAGIIVKRLMTKTPVAKK